MGRSPRAVLALSPGLRQLCPPGGQGHCHPAPCSARTVLPLAQLWPGSSLPPCCPARDLAAQTIPGGGLRKAKGAALTSLKLSSSELTSWPARSEQHGKAERSPNRGILPWFHLPLFPLHAFPFVLAPQVSRGADFGLGDAGGRQTARYRLSRRELVWLAPFLVGALTCT